MIGNQILVKRDLNRALLARQILLRREAISPVTAVERLAGMQAQLPRPPFVGLWSRVEGLEREAVRALLHDKSLVRGTLLRGTLHLSSANDYVAFRPVLQPVLESGKSAILKSRGASLDEAAVLEFAEECFQEKPHTFELLREKLLAKFPDEDERAMGYLARMCTPLVMVPDESDYCFSNSVFTPAAQWLGRPIAKQAKASDLVLRYLAAFGPATVRDAQTWCGLTNLAAVFEELRRKLVVLRDDKRRELFDLPDAPRPGPGEALPVRFLPPFDNILLAHEDRTRIISDEHRPRVSLKNLQVLATFLVDGFVAGTWDAKAAKKSVTMTLVPFDRLGNQTKAELEAEAIALAKFIAPEATEQIVNFEQG